MMIGKATQCMRRRNPKPSQNKIKLLEVRRILEEQTDEEHCLTATQIADKLAVIGIPAARKAIYDDVKALNRFYEPRDQRKAAKAPHIEMDAQNGYYLDNRLFSVADLKLMIDAIKSSKFLSEAKTEELVEGLRSLCSVHQAKGLRRDVIVTNRVKNMNTNIHRNVEYLAAAIEKGVQIRFKYFDYNVKQERVYRRRGGFYTVSPYNLIYSDDNYYLLAFDPEHRDFRTYRIDRMANFATTDLRREGEDELQGLNLQNYQKYTFNMYGGDIKHVKLRVSNWVMGAIIDKFGKQEYANPVDDRHFEVILTVAVSPQFYGWVFGLKNYVTIVSPPEVVEGMKEHLRAVMKRYE